MLIATQKRSLEASEKELESMRADSEAALDITRHLQQQLSDAHATRDELTDKLAGLQIELAHGGEVKVQMEARWVILLV